jgi:hypothetical protein
MRQVFELPSSEAETLAHDSSIGLQSANPGSSSDPDTRKANPSVAARPSVLHLPLVTKPISTMEMTDRADGLAVVLRMDNPQGEALAPSKSPCSTDTACSLIAALQQRLGEMGQAIPLKSNSGPS